MIYIPSFIKNILDIKKLIQEDGHREECALISLPFFKMRKVGV
jgi:hypothetical protein